MIIFLTMVVTC